MTKKIRASQIGFFGLNGARVILGLTILIIIDGIFSFNVIDTLLESDLSGSVLALIFALIIASANLLGIVISQFLDKFMVHYLKKVNNKRLAEFKTNIEEKNGNKLSDLSLYDLYFNGETWNDSNLLPYKQEIMTRWTLILALLLIGYSMSWRNSSDLIESCVTGFSQFISDFSLAILLGTLISLNFMLLSLKLVTERKFEDVLGEWGSQSLLLSSIIIYPIIQVEFGSNLVIDSIFVMLQLILIFILSDSYFIHSRTSSDDKFWVKIRGRIEKEWKPLVILLFPLLLLILVDMIQFFSDLYIPTPVLLFPVLFVTIFIYLLLLQIYKKIKQKTVKDDVTKESRQRVFGTQTEQKVVQWCDLIVMYYELFFYKVNYEILSKLEAYQLVINGVYTYQLIYQYFVKSIEEIEEKGKGGENNTLEDIGIIEIDKGNLEHIKYFNGFINSVKIELDREKLEIAMRFYSSLNEAILAYFVSFPFLNAEKSNLAEGKALSYVIDSTFVEDLIKRISKETLGIFYRNVKDDEKINKEILYALLQNQNLDRELLRKIATEERNTVENLAESSDNSSVLERLSALSGSEFASLREVLTSNFETPQTIILTLSEDREFHVRKAAVKIIKIRLGGFEKLSTYDDHNVRLAVASNKNTPPDILEKLSMDDIWQVRSAVADNSMTSPVTVVTLSEDRELYVREAAIKIIKTRLGGFEKLSMDDIWQVRSAVAGSRNTSLGILEKLSMDDIWQVRSAVADNKNTSLDILEKLCMDDIWQVRSAVAGSSNTPPDILEKLSMDDIWQVRSAVADNSATSPITVITLSEDRELYVREAATKIIKTRLGGFEKLSMDDIWQVRSAVAGSRNTALDILEKLSMDDIWQVRSAVAGSRNTALDILEKLSMDDIWQVRSAVAGSRNTALDILEKLSMDDIWQVRSAVAGSRNTALDILEKLSIDDIWQVRSAVAGSRNTPPDILEKLSMDDDYDVRSAVAGSRNTALDILEKLSMDDDYDVRSAVAGSRNTPPDILEKLSMDDIWQVRLAVADNSATSPIIVIALSDNKNFRVREAAIKIIKTRLRGFEKLSMDDVQWCVSAACHSRTNIMIIICAQFFKNVW